MDSKSSQNLNSHDTSRVRDFFSSERVSEGLSRHSSSLLAVGVGLAIYLFESRKNMGKKSEVDKLDDMTETFKNAKKGYASLTTSPVSLGLGAFAAGTIVGMLVPCSQLERRLMGPSTQRLYGAAKDVFQENTREVASKVKSIANKANQVLSGVSGRGNNTGAQIAH